MHQSAHEAAIRQRIDTLVEAIRAMNLDAVMSCYAADIVSFDIEPPLQHVGAAAKARNWANMFSMFRCPLDYEIRDLVVVAGDDVAFGHALVRSGGTLKNGNTTERWLRSTTCFRKMSGVWLIVHDQISAPLDLASGSALLDLKPS